MANAKKEGSMRTVEGSVATRAHECRPRYAVWPNCPGAAQRLPRGGDQEVEAAVAGVGMMMAATTVAYFHRLTHMADGC